MKLSLKDFTDKVPNEEGKYLFIGEYSLDISLITVMWYPPTENYGMKWDG